MSPYRILLYWGLVGTILAPGRAAFAQEEAKLAFSLLRQNDDVSALIGVENPNAYQRLKRLPFGEFGSLSFGGSYRFQAEMFLNEQFSQEQDQSDIWYLNRVMVHAHARFARHWQVYAELNTSSVVSKANPTPVDEDHFSLNQAFVEYCPNDRFNVRVGRENIRLGSGRLVDVREGPNVRLSFDMAQMTYVQGATQVMAFAGVPVRNRFGSFDNEYLHFDEYLTAIYWTQRLKGNTSVDVYVMYKDEQNKAWNVGVGRDQRVSAGIRHFGQWKDLSYNNEFVYQTGRFGDQSIVGWTASFNLTQRVKLGDFPLQLGLKTEGISGDQDPDDGRLGTFDALYPRGAYFGRVARFGPSNLYDIHPSVEAALGPVMMQVDYVAFWRWSVTDGVYGPPLILDYPSLNEERFIGHQLGTITGVEFAPHVALELETNLIWPGAFLADSGLDDTLFHAVFTAEVKF